MIDFDITDINEAIDGLSYEEQLEYLNDTESYIDKESAKLQNLGVEIRNIKEDIFRDLTLIALHNAGYNILPDEKGNLTFVFDEATITIGFDTIPLHIICFTFNTNKDQKTYSKMISTIVPDYRHNRNFFSKKVTEDTMIDEIVSLVRRLMDK